VDGRPGKVGVFLGDFVILDFSCDGGGVVCVWGGGFLVGYFMGFHLRYGSVRPPSLRGNNGYGFAGMMDGVGRERGVR